MVDRNASYATGALAWCVAGALTDTSFSVRADVAQGGTSARIVVSTNADYSNPVFVSGYVDAVQSTGAFLSYRTLSFDVSGLTPATKYYYQIQFRDAPNQKAVTRYITTSPVGGVAAAFEFIVGSCSKINPNITSLRSLYKSNIHQSMALENPLFFLHIDDMIYSDVPVQGTAARRDTNVRLYCSSPDVDVLNRIAPMAFDPGDHDTLNDSTLDTANGEQIFRDTRTVYRETFPHYPFVQQVLGETNIDHVTFCQQFDIGKVRFLMPDLMSQSRVSGSAMGRGLGNGDYWDQETWLLGAFAQAATDGIEWVFLVLSRGWMDYNQTCFNDVFTADRTSIADEIEVADVKVCLLVGDSHLVTFDDGIATGSYSTSGFAAFPQVLSSGIFINGPGSGCSASWNGTSGAHYVSPLLATQDGQFVRMDLTSDNKNWTATCKGYPINDGTKVPTTVATVSTTDSAPVVSFNNTSPTVAHGVPLTVDLNKTWFGKCSVNWASSDGQNGTVNFKPNRKRASFAITFASAGSPTITLSGPSGCTVSGTNPVTVTVT